VHEKKGTFDAEFAPDSRMGFALLRIQQCLNLHPVPTANRYYSVPLQSDKIDATRPWLDLLNPIHIQDPGSVNADELPRVQALFQARKRLPQHEGILAAVKMDVDARGFDGVHLLRLHEENASLVADYETIELPAMGFHIFEKGHHLPDHFRLPTPRKNLPDVLQRLLEALPLDGLQEIVQGMDAESLEGILIKGGDENHQRHFIFAQFLQHFEAIHHRHLNIQEHEIGAKGLDGLHSFPAVAAFPDYVHIRLIRQKGAHTLDAQGLVVHNKGTDAHERPPFVGFSKLRGRNICTENPL
jgi:hypothetical protein